MYKTFLKHAATHPCSRILGLLDSRVTLGAAAKGASCSLQGALPHMLGGGLCCGNLHVHSGQNRSDGRSGAPTFLKAKPVGSTSYSLPLGFLCLQADGFGDFCCQGVTQNLIPDPASHCASHVAPSTYSPASQRARFSAWPGACKLLRSGS